MAGDRAFPLCLWLPPAAREALLLVSRSALTSLSAKEMTP